MGKQPPDSFVTHARLTPQAQRDVSGIARYIAETSGHRKVATDFTTGLLSKCHGLAGRSAILGRPRDELLPGLRSLPYRGYVIFFTYLPEGVEIVTIIHGHRDIQAMFSRD